jgi:hypothetical protein
MTPRSCWCSGPASDRPPAALTGRASGQDAPNPGPAALGTATRPLWATRPRPPATLGAAAATGPVRLVAMMWLTCSSDTPRPRRTGRSRRCSPPRRCARRTRSYGPLFRGRRRRSRRAARGGTCPGVPAGGMGTLPLPVREGRDILIADAVILAGAVQVYGHGDEVLRAAYAEFIRTFENAATTGSRNRHLRPGRAPLAWLMAQPGDGRGCGSPARSRSVVAGQRSALRRFCPRAARRETAVTAESAWCSALAVRVDGLRRSAASASRWASARVSGRAMASSSHIRRRLEKKAHMLRVPSSFVPWAPALPALSRANHIPAEVRRLPGTGQGSSGRS